MFGLFKRAGTDVNWIKHNLDANSSVTSAPERITSNHTNPSMWASSVGDNGAARFLRQKVGLTEPVGPTETNQAIANRFYIRNQRLAEGIASSKAASAQFTKDMNSAASWGPLDDTTKQGFMNAIAAQNRETTRLQTQRYVTDPLRQAGAHIARTAKWTQEGPMRDRVIKTAAVGAAYGGGNMAMRGLTGGGVTYNNDGERDIMGIPFV